MLKTRNAKGGTNTKIVKKRRSQQCLACDFVQLAIVKIQSRSCHLNSKYKNFLTQKKRKKPFFCNQKVQICQMICLDQLPSYIHVTHRFYFTILPTISGNVSETILTN